MSKTDLYLHEAYMLLALRDDKGTIESRASMYTYGLAGAVLTELAVQKRIRVAEDRKALVDRVDGTPLGDPLLDEVLATIGAASRRRRAQHWIGRIARIKRLRHRVAESLCRRRILRSEQGTVMLLFKRRVYPTLDPAPERRIVEKMRSAIFGTAGPSDSKTVALVALAHVTSLLPAHFDRRELKTRKRRLEEIVAGECGSVAAREAIRAVQAATMAAVIAASTAATAAGS